MFEQIQRQICLPGFVTKSPVFCNKRVAVKARGSRLQQSTLCPYHLQRVFQTICVSGLRPPQSRLPQATTVPSVRIAANAPRVA